MTDTAIGIKGFDVLNKYLTPVEVEIFIMSIIKEKPVDYTQWRKNHLFTQFTSHEEFSHAAQKYCDEQGYTE